MPEPWLQAADCGDGASRASGTRRLRGAAILLVLILLFTGIQMRLQCLSRAWQTELGSYPDEPAHLITGMMIRDYVVSGMKVSPLHYAEDYYLHYPKVGFGIWPPLFHFVEAGWFLLAPPSRTSAFILEALITGALAATLAWTAADLFGWPLGLMAGLAFSLLPVVRIFSATIMADTLMALIAFEAMLAFAAYAKKGGVRRAVLFGVLGGLALATKSNAAALAFLPPIALVLLRQYRRIIAPATLLSALVALLISLPCQMLVVRFWTGTVSPYKYSLAYIADMLRVHAGMYFTLPGIVLFVLALIGISDRVILPYVRRNIEPLWASAAGLVGGMFLFGLAPLPAEPRYHIAAIAAMVLFAAAGIQRLAELMPARGLSARARTLALTAVAAILFWLTTPVPPPHKSYGFIEAAKALKENPAFRNSVMLVSSEDFGEGMFIPEVALGESRPGHYVLRATKVLSRSRWDLDSYELLFRTTDAMEAYLESIPVRLVVFDTTPGPARMAHHALLKQMLDTYKDKWTRIAAWPAGGLNAAGGRIEVYELKGAGDRHGEIKVDMRYTLKTVLEHSDDGGR